MMLLPCNPCRTGLTRWSLDRQRGLARLLHCCSLSVEVADRHSGKVAQPAHRVKDKRLRRAFGILDTARRLGFVMVKGLLPTPVKQGLTRWSLGWRRNVGGQRSFAAHIALLLSERGRCEYRTARTDYCFRAHFNLWWARHGWLLIQPVARRDGQFSRPPYFPAGVNLTAESAIEPPRGGEHGAGETCLNRNSPFAESRN